MARSARVAPQESAQFAHRELASFACGHGSLALKHGEFTFLSCHMLKSVLTRLFYHNVSDVLLDFVGLVLGLRLFSVNVLSVSVYLEVFRLTE